MDSLPLPTHRRIHRDARSPHPQGSDDAWSAPTLIGVGVDGTSSGRDAVVLGSLLARLTGGELMLIAVHREPLAQVVLPEEMDWGTLERQAWATLAETRESLAPDARVAVQSDVLVWRALRQVARREHRDLLVVGSAHHAHDGRVRLGKSATRLISHLECPLAVAPSGMGSREPPRLARIGVGFDGSVESRAALALAVSIATAADAEVEVRVPGGLASMEIALEGNPVAAGRLVSVLERELTSTIGARIRVDITPGSLADALKGLREGVQLLVIGSGHRGRPGRLELGRSGHAAVRNAPCPVIVVPRPVRQATPPIAAASARGESAPGQSGT